MALMESLMVKSYISNIKMQQKSRRIYNPIINNSGKLWCDSLS